MAVTLSEAQHAAKYGQVLLTRHAEDRMDERNIRFNDLKNAIRTATSAIGQPNGKTLVAGGADLDGVEVKMAVVLIRPGLLIVTIS